MSPCSAARMSPSTASPCASPWASTSASWAPSALVNLPSSRLSLASESLDEGRFTRAVGAQDADVLAHGDAQGEAVEGDILAAEHGDILQLEEWWRHRE